ncbi:MAG: TonB-dependent receptor [Campylobacterota bacterium]|nr:TonB-dependent receptor [Campylobacterota bacterium]
MTKIQLSLAAIFMMTTSTLAAAESIDAVITTNASKELSESYPLFNDDNLTITTSNQSAEAINNTTADISVLTAADLAESGDLTVAEAISRVAGISVSNNGGFGQPGSIFMRGQSAGNILILLDGMRLNDPSSTDGRAMIENLMIENIAQIEIVKGGSSTVWGGNASAGVINIITKSAQQKGFHGNAQINGGTYNTKGANASLTYGGEKLTTQILASYLNSDSFSALAPRDAENDAYTNKMFNFKMGYAFNENNALDFSYYLVDAKGDYDDAFSPLLANDAYSHYTSQQENFNLKYHFKHESFDSVNRASRGTFDRDYFTNSFGEAENQYRSTIKEASSINAYLHEKGKIILGLEAKNIDGMNNYISDYPSEPSQSIYKNRAAFLSSLYRYSDDTLFETNLRYDYFDAFSNETTYKIGLKHDHRFLKGFTTRANYYTAYNSPSAYQLANTALGKLLEPSYSKGFDISANYKKLFAISYFNTAVDNPIEYDMDRFGYYNVGGKEKYSGIELSSQYKLSKLGLVLGANLTHLITYESYDTTALSNRAKDTLNVSADYYTVNDMHFGILGQYIGDRVDVSTEETGNYSVWNLNFDTKIAKDFKLYINAKNIFDKEYESVYGYAAAGRSVFARVAYKF